jgi:pimeloyl-ACP methyl ester carboxylesterase
MKNLFYILFVIQFNSLFAQQSEFLGSWKGKLKIGSNALTLVFHVEEKNNQLTAKMDSPDQAAFGIPADKVSEKEGVINIEIKAARIIYSGKLQGKDSILGIFKQGNQELPLILIRVTGEIQTKLNRPQEPKAPFPYSVKEVKIKNKKDGNTLSGTLTVPEGKGPFPAVILVSGSGPQNRDEEIMGHKPFWVIADYLSRNGVAVLRYDDRGTAKSTGDFSKATTFDLSTDAEAVFEFLRKQKKISPQEVGIIGHSEGGMIAPMVASRNSNVSFIVLLAGPGIPIDQLLEIQVKKVSEAEGEKVQEHDLELSRKFFEIVKSEQDLTIARKKMELEVDDFLSKHSAEENPEYKQLFSSIDVYLTPWFRYFIQFNPKDYLSKTSCRVLAINGEKDVQVTAPENLKAIEQILKENGNQSIEIHSIPKLNHLFQHTETGAVSEYATLEETFSVEVLTIISTFILKNK